MTENVRPSARSRGGLKLALLAVLAILALACGTRTAPRPPEATMPTRPDDFSVVIEKNEVRLRWSRPENSVDGHKLYDLAGFVIERRSDATEFAVLAEVPVDDHNRIRLQKAFKWRDLSPLEGRSFYRVRAFAADGQTGSISPGVPIDVSADIVENARLLREVRDAELAGPQEPQEP